MSGSPLIRHLRERKLGQWALAYLAGAWVVYEATGTAVEVWNIPLLLVRSIHILLLIGFFVTLVLAWYHGEKGRQRVSGPELLMIALLLFVAGAGISLLGGEEELAEGAGEFAGSSEIARLVELSEGRPTIAVLPLTNLSAREENSYFAAGIHEELLRRLSLVKALAVISRTSVVQYADAAMGIREIAAELGARYIVEGSVQEDAGRVLIHVQLIDAPADQHLWAERYNRELENVFELQSDVAQVIAREVEAVVTPEEQERIESHPTEDPIAYDLYLRALDRSLFIREDWDARVSLLRRATSRDTTFALGHAKLARTFLHGNIAYEVPAGYDSALARAETATRLDPDLPEAHAIRGFVLGDRGYREEAEAALQRALSLNPSYGYAWGNLAAIGWWFSDYVDGALAGRQGAKLDPRSAASATHLGACLLYVGMIPEAAGWFRHATEVDPDMIWPLFGLAMASWAAGDQPGVRGSVARMREAGADNTMVLAYTGFFEILLGGLEAAVERLGAIDPSALTASTNSLPTAEALLGWVEVRTGRPDGRGRLEALRLRRLEEVAEGQASQTGLNDLSVIASVLGDEGEQLHWFREAARRERMRDYWFRDAPWYDGIRDLPDFQAWLRDAERRMEEYQRELAPLGPWTPEAVLGGGYP